MSAPDDIELPGKRAMLRHAVATVAYRGAKALRDAPDGFAAFKAGDTSRTPVEILAHMGDLFDWALSLAQGENAWNNATPMAWDDEAARFFGTLERFDAYLATDAPLGVSAEQLFQGPVADALTHVGQIAAFRRLAGSHIRGENYSIANVAAGHVGADQQAPSFEFG